MKPLHTISNSNHKIMSISISKTNFFHNCYILDSSISINTYIESRGFFGTTIPTIVNNNIIKLENFVFEMQI